MKQESPGNSRFANNEYHFSLKRSHIAVIVVTSLLAILVYWLTLQRGAPIAGALAVTALLIPVGMSAVDVFEARDAFISFGNPVLFLVLGGYALAVAVEQNGVGGWLTQRILGLAGSRTIGLLTAFMVTSAVLSMLISNTATTALLLPVAVGVLGRHHVDANLSRVILLGVAYGASIGGVATLTGSPPNAAGLLDISFLQWLSFGLPVSLSMLVVAIPVLWWTYRPEQKQITVNLGEEVALTGNGKRTLAVLGITLFLWLFGPSLGNWLAIPPALFSSAAVACIALALLVLTRCVKWKALEQGIHWGVLILLAGGLTLGRGLTESRAADWLASLLASSTGDLSLFALLLILVTIGVFATELISNTAVTAKLAPILMGVAFAAWAGSRKPGGAGGDSHIHGFHVTGSRASQCTGA